MSCFDGRTGRELPGTSSHDLDGRDSTSAGARILCGLRRQQHLTNHIALPIARTSMRAIARGVPPPVRGRSPDRRSMPAQSVDPRIDEERQHEAVEGAAHDDAGEERQGELDPAHRAAALSTARTYPAGGTGSRYGSDQRAVMA